MDEGPVGQVPGVLDELLGVAAAQHRLEEDAVRQRLDVLGRLPVLRQVGGGPDVGEVQRHGELALARDHGPQRRHGAAVGEVEVVRGRDRCALVGAAGGVHSGAVAQEGGAPRLVQGGDPRDPVAQRAADDVGELGEVVRGLPVEPAATVLEHLGEVPVVEREHRGDVAFEQPVHQSLVEVEPGLVDLAGAVGEHARPGDREPVGAEPERGHQVQVLLHPVVVVAGDVAVVAAVDLAGSPAERVPDARRAAVLGGSPLDLERSRAGAPGEAFGKLESCGHPLTAPCITPPTMCFPRNAKAISTGMVP